MYEIQFRLDAKVVRLLAKIVLRFQLTFALTLLNEFFIVLKKLLTYKYIQCPNKGFKKALIAQHLLIELIIFLLQKTFDMFDTEGRITMHEYCLVHSLDLKAM